MSDYDIVIKLDPGQPVQGAKQVTAAVAGLEAQGKKAKEAMDGAASAARSLKSIDFKQAAAAGAQAWGILSQKFELGNTLLGKAIDSTVKFAALGAQLGGPWGAALGAIAGGLIEVTDNITGLRSEVTKLAEESKKLAEDHIAKMGGRLGELAREAKKTAGELKEMNDGLYALPGALAATFDAFNKERDVVKRAREEIEKYNAAKFAASPQGNALKGFSGGVMGREAKPTAGGERQYYNGLSPLDFAPSPARTPYMGLGERADGGTGPYAVNVTEQHDLQGIALDNLNTKIKANADETLLLAANTRTWRQELAASNTVLLAVVDGIKQAGASFVDTLVDGAFGADVSWKRWGEDMLKMFAKLILQASLLKAIGSPTGGVGGTATGLYKLLGFASGGVIMPSGGGTADTQTVAFRKSPSETVHINTPAQEAAYRNGGGGGGPVNFQIVNTPVDDRALLQAFSSPAGTQTFLNQVRANRGAIKALLE